MRKPKPKSLMREVAYERFKVQLFKRNLVPGQFVSQGELCELLDVPLGPTREALKRLEAESLVRLIPQRGIQIADMDRNYYQDHLLTIARHPSETDERMMIRVLAFALHADETLSFGKGLSTDDEPDLWRKDLTGSIAAWIDVGQPDDKRIRKACGRAGQVYIYSYGGQASKLWWSHISEKLDRTRNLTVRSVPQFASKALASLADRAMELHCTIQDDQVWLANGRETVQIELGTVKSPPAAAY